MLFELHELTRAAVLVHASVLTGVAVQLACRLAGNLVSRSIRVRTVWLLVGLTAGLTARRLHAVRLVRCLILRCLARGRLAGGRLVVRLTTRGVALRLLQLVQELRVILDRALCELLDLGIGRALFRKASQRDLRAIAIDQTIRDVEIEIVTPLRHPMSQLILLIGPVLLIGRCLCGRDLARRCSGGLLIAVRLLCGDITSTGDNDRAGGDKRLHTFCSFVIGNSRCATTRRAARFSRHLACRAQCAGAKSSEPRLSSMN